MILRLFTSASSHIALRLGGGLLALLLLVSCSSKTDADHAQDVAVETLTAFYAGDIDTYITHSDFGTDLSAAQDSLMRLVLQRYVDRVNQKGGLKVIEPLDAQQEDDTTVLVSYALRFVDGSVETCLKQMRRCGDEWKMCVSAY